MPVSPTPTPTPSVDSISVTTTTATPTPTATINPAITNGSIYFETNPAGASVFINSTNMGTTDFILSNLPSGSYLFRIQKSGYIDYSGMATVTTGKTTNFYRTLTALDTETPVSTTIPKTTIKTAQPTKISTVKTPTPWPSATPTQASPMDALAVICAAAAGIVLLRKR